MRTEIYINEKRVDIDETSEFALQFFSPIYTDLKNIVQNKTTTITLPKTSRNLSIIENSDLLPVDSQFPYLFHKCEIRLDGIPVVKYGRTYMLPSEQDEIKMCVVWGYDDRISSTLNKKLNELTYYEGYGWKGSAVPGKDWSTVPGGSDIEIAGPVRMLYVNPNPSSPAAHNPFIELAYVGSAIWEDMGYSFNYEGLNMERSIQLQTRKQVAGYKRFATQQRSNMSTQFNFFGRQDALSINNNLKHMNDGMFFFNSIVEGNFIFEIIGINPQLFKMVEIFYSPTREPSNTITSYFSRSLKFERVIKPLENYIHNGESKAAYYGLRISLSEIISDEDMLKLRIKITSQSVNVKLNQVYPISINMPSVTVADFLKNWCNIEGMFFYIDKNGVPKLKKYGDILTAPVIDWTDKVMSIKDVSYSLDGYARKNIFKYKDDQGTNYISSGAIMANNAALEAEKVMFESPFSPPNEGIDGVAEIINMESDGKYVDSDRSYIVNKRSYKVGTEFYTAAAFTTGKTTKDGADKEASLCFDKVISNNQQLLSAILGRTKVFTCEARINVVDMLNLSFVNQYYIGQAGGNCLLQSLDIRGNQATAKFIKL